MMRAYCAMPLPNGMLLQEIVSKCSLGTNICRFMLWLGGVCKEILTKSLTSSCEDLQSYG
eukprot:3690950-Amphidinium_carterae.4